MPWERDKTFGCLLWTGQLDPDGYGVTGPRSPRAHVLRWRAAGRAVSDGLVLDHLCRRRACAELLHLEAVSRSVNELRKSWRVRCRRGTCPVGHRMTDVVVTPEGGRLCRTCTRELLLDVALGVALA